MAVVDYSAEIERYTDILKSFRKSKELFGNEQKILALEQQRYELLYQQIHGYLGEKGTEKAERKSNRLQ